MLKAMWLLPLWSLLSTTTMTTTTALPTNDRDGDLDNLFAEGVEGLLPDLVSLPEWQPFYARLLESSSLRDLLQGPDVVDPSVDPTTKLLRHHHKSRTLQTSATQDIPCNQILDTISLSDLAAIMTSIVASFAPQAQGGLQQTYLESLLVHPLQTSMHVVQVCGSCVDSIPAEEQPKNAAYCAKNIYGADRGQSGLLLIPAPNNEGNMTMTGSQNETMLIAPATYTGYVYTHATRVSLAQTPSILWQGRQNTNPQVWFYLAMASTQQVVFLMPDNMGYGKSAELFKPYLIRKAYETAIVPLWYQAQALVKEWSGGCAELHNKAIVAGYSEGGYSSVVAAQALHEHVGVEIVRLQTGAGPYKLASEAPVGLYESIKAGNLSESDTPILGLLGVAYTSTYPDVANYGTGQGILANATRDPLVQALTGHVPGNGTAVVELIMKMTAPTYNPLLLLRQDFLSALELFSANETTVDGCQTFPLAVLQQLQMDKLCQALVENDLTNTLENQVNYPTEFCQSPQDEIVVQANLPNLTANPNFSRVPGITGGHVTAGETCFLHVVQTAVQSASAVAPVPKTNCTPTPGAGGPAMAPTMAPNQGGNPASAFSISGRKGIWGWLALATFVLSSASSSF